jgi:formiminotetrahydrofolate cyclodeaminase
MLPRTTVPDDKSYRPQQKEHPMIDIRPTSIGDFLDQLASGNATPGGGAGAALSGAMGAALLSMVANLTTGRKKYAEVEEEVQRILARTEEIRAEMTNLAQLDAHVFDKVMDAYRLPKETEGQKSSREAAIQDALMDATQVPLKVAVQASELFDYAPILAEKGNQNAVSDVGAGLLLADAAMHAALMNVHINLALIQDEAFTRDMQQRVDTLLQGRDTLKEQVLATVRSKL